MVMAFVNKLVPFASSMVLIIYNLVSTVSSSSHENATTHKHAVPRNKHNNSHEISPRLLFDIKLHGVLLWASVGFLVPFSILVKRMSNTESVGRLRIVFYVHAITEICAVILGTASAVMSIKHFDNAFNNDHQRIGLAFYVVMWLQVLTGIFRPHRGSRGRGAWFLVHWLMGVAVSLLGIINIYTGLQAYQKRTSSNHVMIWKVVFTVELFIIIFIYLLQEKWHYIQRQGSVLGNKPVQPTDQEMSPRSQQKELSAEQ